MPRGSIDLIRCLLPSLKTFEQQRKLTKITSGIFSVFNLVSKYAKPPFLLDSFVANSRPWRRCRNFAGKGCHSSGIRFMCCRNFLGHAPVVGIYPGRASIVVHFVYTHSILILLFS